jgi:hypothetical protein
MNISEANEKLINQVRMKEERVKGRRNIWMTWDQYGIDTKIKRKNKSTITIKIGTTIKISKRLVLLHGSYNIAVVMLCKTICLVDIVKCLKILN